MKPRFMLGRVLITPGALAMLRSEDVSAGLFRHWCCDWGDVDDEDKRQNDLALGNGTRILSAYRGTNAKRFWIITEADRSATTILLPEEY